MKKKIDYFKLFINSNNIFICPICHEKLKIDNNCFKCINNHTYDFSYKGSVNLIKTNYYKSSRIYNNELFINRRKFISNNFYDLVYKNIATEISKIKGVIKILDVGCGEATHSIKILNALKQPYIYYGFDYSHDAINLATDYCNDKSVFFMASVDNIPIEDNSIDVIIDFLSPFNEKEFDRVLKRDGIIIKISPSLNYLVELRKSINISEYSKENEVFNNIDNKFNVVKRIKIEKQFNINKEQLEYLIKMTPMLNKNGYFDINKITIDLNIYVLKVKK